MLHVHASADCGCTQPVSSEIHMHCTVGDCASASAVHALKDIISCGLLLGTVCATKAFQKGGCQTSYVTCYVLYSTNMAVACCVTLHTAVNSAMRCMRV